MRRVSSLRAKFRKNNELKHVKGGGGGDNEGNTAIGRQNEEGMKGGGSYTMSLAGKKIGGFKNSKEKRESQTKNVKTNTREGSDGTDYCPRRYILRGKRGGGKEKALGGL